MTATDALDIHTALAVRLGDPGMQRYLNALARSSHLEDGQYGIDFGGFGNVIAHQVLRSATFHVDASVTPEILRTAESYRDGDTIATVARPLRPRGVMVLDEPIRFQEPRSREQSAHIVNWQPLTEKIRMPIGFTPDSPSMPVDYPFGDPSTFIAVEPGEPDYEPPLGYLVTLWNDTNREVDEVTLELFETLAREGAHEGRRHAVQDAQRVTGGFFPIQTYAVEANQRCGPMWHAIEPGKLATIKREGYIPNPKGSMSVGRLILAIWDLMSQTVPAAELDDTVRHVARTTRKRAQREGLSGEVSVIVLRREKRPVLNPGSGSKLDHQVPVAGHYRNQACGKGRKERKRIWVAEHKRGPEGTPVINKPKVYDLRR